MEKPKRIQKHIRLDTLITQAKNEAQRHIDEKFTYLALSRMAISSFEKRDRELFVIMENRKDFVNFDAIERKIYKLIARYERDKNRHMIDLLHDLINHVKMFDPNYSPWP